MHKHKHKTAGQSVNTESQTAPSGNKMASKAMVDEKLAESVRKFPILYDKSSKDFKDKHKKGMGGCGERMNEGRFFDRFGFPYW